jgi:hypothetical protein
MTKKTYPKTPRLSRSTRAKRPRAYPFERRYDALRTDDPHPVDALIDRIPTIAALDRKLLRLSKRHRAEVRDVRRFIDYEDARLEQRCMREQTFYDAGHQQGRLDGAAESISSSIDSSRDARAFARRVQIARLSSGLPTERVLAMLLEMARGLALTGARHRNRPSHRRAP